MTIHALGIFDFVPNLRHGGGGITAYSMLMALVREGHRVSAVVAPDAFPTMAGGRDENIAELRRHGIEVFDLASPELPVGVPLKVEPAARRIGEIARSISPDVCFAYHWDAINLMALIPPSVPRFGAVGDPFHLPFLIRRRFSQKYMSDEERVGLDLDPAGEARYIETSVGQMATLLNRCQSAGAFAAHHAAMLAENGAPHCRYLRTPVPDPLVPGRPLPPKADRFKILHIGHLKGIATLTGVEMLAERTLPALEALLPPGSFEIHIVGGFPEAVPENLRHALAHPAVVFRGHVTPPDEEFLTSHLTIVPTPVDLGIRVRILTAFSFGCAVVAHPANACGIPELVHGENCLLGDDGPSLAAHCAAMFHDPALRKRLERASRATYERFFSLDTAGKAIADDIAALATQRTGAPLQPHPDRSQPPAPQTLTLDQALALAGRLRAEGQAAQAEMVYRSILKAQPGHAPSLFGLGELLLGGGKAGEAIETFSHALLAAPGLLDAYLGLGSAFEARGNSEAARAAYRRALALKEDFSPARERLARLSITQPANLQAGSPNGSP